MSLGRLLLSVRDTLREKLTLNSLECEVMPGPEPSPSCGQKFISVYGTNWSSSSGSEYADRAVLESYDIACAVTFRSNYVPYDRLGEALYVNRLIGMEDYCRQIIDIIHINQDINDKTDILIDEDYGDNAVAPHGMVEYLRWSYCDSNPKPVTGSWFSAEDTSGSGLVMEVRFNSATRFSSFGDGGVGSNFA